MLMRDIIISNKFIFDHICNKLICRPGIQYFVKHISHLTLELVVGAQVYVDQIY